MTRRNWLVFAAMLIAASALALSGCGGDDGGLSAEDMARLDAAEAAAAAAQAEAEAAEAAAEAAQAEAATAHEEAEAALAEAEAAHEEAHAAEEATAAAAMEIAAAQAEAEAATMAAEAAQAEAEQAAEDAASDLADAKAELTAKDATPLEILGGTKGTASAADRAVMAGKIVGQLNGRPKYAGTMVNLPPDAGTYDDMLTDSRATHAAGGGINSDGSAAEDSGFLRDGEIGVDLTSPGDIATLKVGNLLKVNGVDLKSFSLKETDKVRAAITMANGDEAGTDNAPLTDAQATHVTITTLRADGSMSEIRVQRNTGAVTYSKTTTFVGGNKIEEYNPTMDAGAYTAATGALAAGDGTAGNENDIGAVITLSDGRVKRFVLEGATDPEFSDGATQQRPIDGTPPAPANTLPSADLAVAKRTYANPGGGYTVDQHNAKGYGAWLEDSFFVAYVMNAEDDAIISDPDETVMKIAWGGRERDSEIASDLSGRGETAMWKGLMVGHDMDSEAATSGMMLKGNAMVTARVGGAVLGDPSDPDTHSVIDVSLTNIITAKGTAVSRVADGIHWTNLDLVGGEFAKGSEIEGAFYDNGNEVVGQFDKEDILGVFGAMEYEMMMDMAEN